MEHVRTWAATRHVEHQARRITAGGVRPGFFEGLFGFLLWIFGGGWHL